MDNEPPTADQSSPVRNRAVVFRAGSVRVKVAVSPTEECPVITFTPRSDGEPLRCEVCPRPAHAPKTPSGGAVGRVRCQAHQRRRADFFVPHHPVTRVTRHPGAVVPSALCPVLADRVRPTGEPSPSARERWRSRVARHQAEESRS